jgi:hypothetical protein
MLPSARQGSRAPKGSSRVALAVFVLRGWTGCGCENVDRFGSTGGLHSEKNAGGGTGGESADHVVDATVFRTAVSRLRSVATWVRGST